MKIFVSYPSARRDVAERLKLALQSEGHDVFFDRDDLGVGEAFHQVIREAIDAAHLCIFLISPESVAPGSYALAELGMIERRWPTPAGQVLPVMVVPTPKNTIPPYLMAVTLLEPRGELVAETVAMVAKRAASAHGAGRRWTLAAVVALALAAAGYAGYRYTQAQRAAAVQQAAQVEITAAASRATALCRGGSPADAYAQLALLSARPGAPAAVRAAQEDCAMQWLRDGRITEGQGTFEQMVAPLKPVLTQALVAGAGGQRAADLRAHLGWADYLIARDGRKAHLDPTPSYRQALLDDAANVYAHAMLAHWVLRDSGERREDALQHFDAALKSGRDVPFVRVLQLGAMVGSDALAVDALRVLDQMRQRNEPLDGARRGRAWSHLYARPYVEADVRRLLGALPPEDGLQTFLWLFPKAQHNPAQLPAWRLMHGLLLANAGRAADARADLLALQKELRAERSSGPLPDTVDRLLAAR